ncbi:MAG: hypothetical protein ACE1S7_03045 [Candidatus Tisiphia sp.]
MHLSIPFLATDIKQLPKANIGNNCVEAVVFNREDIIDNNSWQKIWHNVQLATTIYGNKNVTFHFPVNHCNYVEDCIIKDKLLESYQRASDLGLWGIVVHANQIKSIKEWQQINIEGYRQIVIDVLVEIKDSFNSFTWIALENMPIMDNYGLEIDPTFIYPSDFLRILNTPIKIVWDICHFTATIANTKEVIAGRHEIKYYPNLKTELNISDLDTICSHITHWHFASFKGVAKPDSTEYCQEGILPEYGTMNVEIYEDFLDYIIRNNFQQHIVLEIIEENYENRINAKKMIEWVNNQINLIRK